MAVEDELGPLAERAIAAQSAAEEALATAKAAAEAIQWLLYRASIVFTGTATGRLDTVGRFYSEPESFTDEPGTVSDVHFYFDGPLGGRQDFEVRTAYDLWRLPISGTQVKIIRDSSTK